MAVLKSGIKIKKLNDDKDGKNKSASGKADKADKPKRSFSIGKKINLGKFAGDTRSGGKMPEKNYINLAVVEETPFITRKSVPIILLIVLLFLAFFKFMVIDKFTEMISASQEVLQLQSDLDTAYTTIESMGDIEDTYAHYTYSGMTAEEMGRVDRVSVMKLVDKALLGGDYTRSWQLSGNIMTLQVSGKSLQQLNQLAQALETETIVQRCVINTANKNIRTDANAGKNVTVTFIIYLQQPATVDVVDEQKKINDGGISEAAEKLADRKAAVESQGVEEE